MDIEPVNLDEWGRDSSGKPTSYSRRLFMQFLAFENLPPQQLAAQAENHNNSGTSAVQAVVYADLNDSNGSGLLSFCEDPDYLLDVIQPLTTSAISNNGSELPAQPKNELTMMGRTYSIGYEQDLEDVLIKRPIRRACDVDAPWAVYYPVRRHGSFEQQPQADQFDMLKEHGNLGHSFGEAGQATDIRLAAHGLNRDDNDFIIGLLGKDLFPLSALVQKMRKTRQTSEFIQSMGPFFVGKAIWQPKIDIEQLI